MIKKASFSFENYTFNKVQIDFDINSSSELEIKFTPSGVFKKNETGSIFELKFIFTAKNKKSSKTFVLIECNAIFRFTDVIEIKEIPSFFYANSIAIVFPYIRAFVSTVTLQANFTPIILPTMNLSTLEEPLKCNTKEI